MWSPPICGGRRARCEPASGAVEERERPTEPRGSETPYALHADRNTDTVWICGTASDTLISFEPEAERWRIYPLPTRVTFSREIDFDDQGRIYVSDSESDDFQNPGFEMGIRVGELETGWVTTFILYPWGDPRDPGGGPGAEFVAVDLEGNIYGGEPRPRRIQKYVRVRP